jgi:tetratricopeptide (TPR) repeat protein
VALDLEQGRAAISDGAPLRARDIFERSLADAMALPEGGSRSRLVVQALVELGDLYVALGDYATAGEFLAEGLRRARAELGEADLDTASVWNSLGMWHRYRGELEKAAAAYARAHQILEYRGASVELASVLHNSASLAHLAGDLATAEAMIHDAIELRGGAEGTVEDLGVLAVILADEDRFDEAQAVYDQVRTLLIEERGPGDVELIYLGANEAVLSYRRGDLDEAEHRYVAVIAASEQVLGQDHPHTGEVLANLAALRESAGDPAGAHRDAGRAVAILSPSVDESHPSLRLAEEVFEATRVSVTAAE